MSNYWRNQVRGTPGEMAGATLIADYSGGGGTDLTMNGAGLSYAHQWVPPGDGTLAALLVRLKSDGSPPGHCWGGFLNDSAGSPGSRYGVPVGVVAASIPTSYAWVLYVGYDLPVTTGVPIWVTVGIDEPGPFRSVTVSDSPAGVDVWEQAPDGSWAALAPHFALSSKLYWRPA
jgi:hypothetical protein